MIDLETLGKGQDALVLSIGAVIFDPETEEMGTNNFHKFCNPQSAINAGRTIDPDTILWWLSQSDDARKSLIEGTKQGVSWGWLLESFAEFVPEGAIVWGNGAAFDIAILENAYRQLGLPIPWKFRNVRDMRTVMDLAAPMEKPKFEGTKHNALHDAVYQAVCVTEAYRKLGRGNGGG
ncbi:MAG: 3'-5' exonuclease [Planctomycetota bacterium]|jgi:DNA polymerase III epsilon subunit-like protein